MKNSNTIDRFFPRIPFVTAPATKPLTIPELTESLASGFAKNKEEERYVRLSLWRNFNDRIRKKWWFKMTHEKKWSKLLRNEDENRLWHENLTLLFDLMDVSNTDDRLTQAEICRVQGEFDRAVEILDEITDSDYEKSVRIIRRCCQNRDPFVAVIVGSASSIYDTIYMLMIGIVYMCVAVWTCVGTIQFFDWLFGN